VTRVETEMASFLVLLVLDRHRRLGAAHLLDGLTGLGSLQGLEIG
jgi:hypothetical protein